MSTHEIESVIANMATDKSNDWSEEIETLENLNEIEVTLPSGQRIIVWVGTSDADGSALVQVDTEGAEGNVRIFVNDGDPVFDENPETGRYEVAPGYEEEA